MRSAIAVALLFLANVAIAAPHTVLVLRSEGSADAASRTSTDSQVLRLAKNLDGKVDAGDITLTEAAAVVGCNPSESSCRDQVLDTFGVDEVVATTVTATPTGLNVTVRRITKGAQPQAAQSTIAAGASPDAKLDADIGPLFGIATAPEAPPPVPGDTLANERAPLEPPPPLEDLRHDAPAPTVTAAPTGVVAPMPEGPRPSRRWQFAGMVGGGACVLLGILMWNEASAIQNEIDDKPEPVTDQDFRDLRDLEKKGDGLAGGGNLFVLGGAALGGVSAYFYWKAGKTPRSTTARIAPAAMPNGAGVTLTIGGSP